MKDDEVRLNHVRPGPPIVGRRLRRRLGEGVGSLNPVRPGPTIVGRSSVIAGATRRTSSQSREAGTDDRRTLTASTGTGTSGRGLNPVRPGPTIVGPRDAGSEEARRQRLNPVRPGPTIVGAVKNH